LKKIILAKEICLRMEVIGGGKEKREKEKSSQGEKEKEITDI